MPAPRLLTAALAAAAVLLLLTGLALPALTAAVWTLAALAAVAAAVAALVPGRVAAPAAAPAPAQDDAGLVTTLTL